jgi:hypothetical protein
MPTGAGLFPAGLSPAGFGLPETAAPSPIAPLPDLTTGLPQPGRLLVTQQAKGEPNTIDYQFGADGRLQGMSAVQQLVMLAIFNIDLSTLTEKGPNFPAKLQALVAAAIAPLVALKLVGVRSITINEPSSDAGMATLSWVDLTAPPGSIQARTQYQPIG